MARIDYSKVAPDAVKALYGVQRYNQGTGIDAHLRALIDLRVSQINGCAFCVDMHVEEARQAGETPQRLDLFPVWREAPYFSERERAALAWAESVTLLAQTHVPDEVFQEVRRHFEEKELVDLTMIVAAINAWNRLGVSFRSSPPPR